MMVDHLTSWPVVKAIPDKEAITVANAIFEKLILEHGESSTGEAPYTLVYNRDPPIPIHKLIKVVELYMGKNTFGMRTEQSRGSLSIAAKCWKR